jgi:uncharacterized membrane protein YbhN (UPF0104 family)
MLYLKVDVDQVKLQISKISIFYIIGALLCLFISQIISALRMRYYYLVNDILCSYFLSFKLYWVGMFYNFILPGGIGGEAYKIYIMQKNKVSSLLSLRLALSNRLSGLYILLILSLIFYLMMDYPDKIIAMLLLLSVVITYPIFAYFILKEKLSVIIGSAIYSIFVQIFSILSGLIILSSLVEVNLNYLILFMVSSLVQIIPISIAGIGMRELSFIYGSNFFPVDIEKSISFLAIYFAINLLLSVTGVIFITKKFAIS